MRGDSDAAASAAESLVDATRVFGEPAWCASALLPTAAEAFLEAGDLARARTIATEAHEHAVQGSLRGWEIEASCVLARVRLRESGPGSAAGVRALLDTAERRVEETGALALAPHVRLVRAELAEHLDDAAARDRELRETHRLFSEMGATGHAERLARDLEG